MEFELDAAVPLLRRTPAVLRELLAGLPSQWTQTAEGPGTWSAFDVVGHLIHGERTDWVPRIEHIIRQGSDVPFPPFDREAMLSTPQTIPLPKLLDTFARLREESLRQLGELALTPADMNRRGLHPELGTVTLEQHLATWVAHDLSHLAQIARVMARQYVDVVGPWRAYLRILQP